MEKKNNQSLSPDTKRNVTKFEAVSDVRSITSKDTGTHKNVLDRRKSNTLVKTAVMLADLSQIHTAMAAKHKSALATNAQ